MSINIKLKQKILDMVQMDQEIRNKQRKQFKALSKSVLDDGEYTSRTSEMRTEMEKLDKKHTKEMKKIINKHGWPGKSLVGEEANNATWLLVQHSVHDLSFQKKCLTLLKKSIEQEESQPKHAAYLEDRILMMAGLKQKYGTQFVGSKTGKQKPYPIEDLNNIDNLRESVGLGSFEEYKKRMENL